ncbi:MAG TPA: hypothetical protein VGP47_08950 [Parachlamydiaceae bacterium]|nr:hypothetical protein [Parachlamydiaceae bacterium]
MATPCNFQLAKIFYFRPHGDPTFRCIDLKRINFDAGTEHENIPVHTDSMTLIDLTDQLNPANIYNKMRYGKNPANPIVAKLIYPNLQTPSSEKTNQVSTAMISNNAQLESRTHEQEIKIEKIAQDLNVQLTQGEENEKFLNVV